MNLYEYDLEKNAENGFTFHIYDPVTGKKTDAEIDLVGSDSKTYRRARSDALRAMAKGDIKEEEQFTAMVVAKCITGWRNLNNGSDEILFSHDSAYKMLCELYWLCELLINAIEKRTNFTKPLKKN